jgi:polyisoprenoid-binding protein YceI
MTTKGRGIRLRIVGGAFYCLLACAAFSAQAQEQVPIFVISRQESTVTFYVKASIELRGTFDKWDATLTFASRDVTTGVFRATVQSASIPVAA